MKILWDLARIVGSDHVKSDIATRQVYSFDAFLASSLPLAIVEPNSVDEVSSVVRCLKSSGVPYLVRGAGTGYAGGATPIRGEIIISSRRMSKIRAFDPVGHTIEVEAGLITKTLRDFVAAHGLYYPPDPSSLSVCTIGGNIATNAGGPHCLGYGTTANYVLEVECVDADGCVRRLKGDCDFLDIRGLLVGSEGTLAIITAVKLRLIDQPPARRGLIASFVSNSVAIEAVTAVFKSGQNPIALDMVSQVHHPHRLRFSFRNDALLFIETAGSYDTVRFEMEGIARIIEAYEGQSIDMPHADYMLKRFRATRSRCMGIVVDTGLSGYFLFDAVVRRSDLLAVMEKTSALADRYGFVLASTFHAGDGNIHPTPFFDRRDPDHLKMLDSFRRDVFFEVRELGGIATGEHGVGIEKADVLPHFLTPSAFSKMIAVKRVFQPEDRLNGGKIFCEMIADTNSPRRSVFLEALHSCIESGEMAIDSANGYAVVPGRTTLAELSVALGELPYRFPYIPVSGGSTIPLDELFRAGVRSLLELRFGHPRELLLGALIGDTDGNLHDYGSFFPKDVMGYGLRRLIFGSGLVIGVCKVLILRLTPMPGKSLLLRVESDDVDISAVLGPDSSCLAGKVILPGTVGRKGVQLLALEGTTSEVDRSFSKIANSTIGSADFSVITSSEASCVSGLHASATRCDYGTLELGIINALIGETAPSTSI